MESSQPLLGRYPVHEQEQGSPGPSLPTPPEERQWIPYNDLDRFFSLLYQYWREKGLAVIVVTRCLNLLALAFTILVSAFLLLYFDWRALSAACLEDDSCDIADVAVRSAPLAHGSSVGNAFKILFLACFSLYWLWSAGCALYEIRHFIDVRHFCRAHLFVADGALQHMTWPELLRAVVALQSHFRFSLRAELTEHDVVMRIMRKDDYLIGLLNMGVLDLHVPMPGLRRRPLLTTSVNWALRVALLDAMFDDAFELKAAFLRNGVHLARRFKIAAVLSTIAAPFLLLFLLMHFLLKNLERIYHHPGTLGRRRWSMYAYWRMREFGELPHFVETRLNSAAKAADKYCAQFPSPVTAAVASFVAYVAAAIAGMVIAIVLTHDTLTERHAYGHTLVWWLAAAGMVLAVARALMEDDVPSYDPEAAMMEVCAYTHWVPSYWRGRAHSSEVRDEFRSLYQYQLALFLEEVVSVVLLPWLLAVSLPRCADDVAEFLKHCSIYNASAGHICSMATFDLDRHGNPRYNAVTQNRVGGTHQGKLEKSLLSFAACYPHWKPSNPAAQSFVQNIEARASMMQPGAGRPPAAPIKDVPGYAISGAWMMTPAGGEGDGGAGTSPAGAGLVAPLEARESLRASGASSTVELAAVGGTLPPAVTGTGAAPGGFAGTAALRQASVERNTAASALPSPAAAAAAARQSSWAAYAATAHADGSGLSTSARHLHFVPCDRELAQLRVTAAQLSPRRGAGSGSAAEQDGWQEVHVPAVTSAATLGSGATLTYTGTTLATTTSGAGSRCSAGNLAGSGGPVHVPPSGSGDYQALSPTGSAAAPAAATAFRCSHHRGGALPPPAASPSMSHGPFALQGSALRHAADGASCAPAANVWGPEGGTLGGSARWRQHAAGFAQPAAAPGASSVGSWLSATSADRQRQLHAVLQCSYEDALSPRARMQMLSASGASWYSTASRMAASDSYFSHSSGTLDPR